MAQGLFGTLSVLNSDCGCVEMKPCPILVLGELAVLVVLIMQHADAHVLPIRLFSGGMHVRVFNHVRKAPGNIPTMAWP